MSVADDSPYRVRILQKGADCTVVALPSKPLQYVLLSEGFFCIRLESAVDAPLIAKLEIDGVQARSNFRILPNGTHTIRETRSHMGERSTPLSFTPTSHHTDPANLTGDRDVDMFCGMLRVFFFSVQDTSRGKWDLASRDPIAIVMLRYGYTKQLLALYPTEVRAHRQAIKEAAIATGGSRVAQTGSADRWGGRVSSSSLVSSRPSSRNSIPTRRVLSASPRPLPNPHYDTRSIRPSSMAASTQASRRGSAHRLSKFDDSYEGIPRTESQQFHSSRDPLTTGTFGPLAMALMAGGSEGGEGKGLSPRHSSRGPLSGARTPRAASMVMGESPRDSRRSISPTRGVNTANPLMEIPHQQPTDGAFLPVARNPGGPGGRDQQVSRHPSNEQPYLRYLSVSPGAVSPFGARKESIIIDHSSSSFPISRCESTSKGMAAGYDSPSGQGRPALAGVGAQRTKLDPKEERIKALEDMLLQEQEYSAQLQLQCNEWKHRYEDLSALIHQEGGHHRMSSRRQSMVQPTNGVVSQSPPVAAARIAKPTIIASRPTTSRVHHHPTAIDPPAAATHTSPPVYGGMGPRRRSDPDPQPKKQEAIAPAAAVPLVSTLDNKQSKGASASKRVSNDHNELVVTPKRSSNLAVHSLAGSNSSSMVHTHSSAPTVDSRPHSPPLPPSALTTTIAQVSSAPAERRQPSSLSPQLPRMLSRASSSCSDTSTSNSSSSSSSDSWLPPDIVIPDPREKTNSHQTNIPRRKMLNHLS